MEEIYHFTAGEINDLAIKNYFYGNGFQFALDPQGYDEKYHPHPIPSPENLPF